MDKELLEAVYHDNLKLIKKLIKAGVDINYQNEFGNTALITACF
jgi:ankyrin repeat protein